MLLPLRGTIANPEDPTSVGVALFQALQGSHAGDLITFLTDTYAPTGKYRVDIICSCGCKYLNHQSWHNHLPNELDVDLLVLTEWALRRGQIEGETVSLISEDQIEDLLFTLS